MQQVDKKLKCPLCGAKNPASAMRCGTCTRPLNDDRLASQAVYEEALWAERIASKGSRTRTNPYVVLAIAVLAGLAINYFWLGYGPDWIHAEKPAPKGSTWTEHKEQPEYRADMPGTPVVAINTTPGGLTVKSASVWVDPRWDVLRDQNTRSTGGLLESRRGLYAMIATATSNDPGPATLRDSFAPILAAIAPGATFGSGEIRQLQDPPYGEQYEVDYPYTDWPDASGKGVVLARVISFNSQLYIAATFFAQTVEPALYDKLVKNFIPTGAPEEPVVTPSTVNLGG